jgi:hypothetical protein
MQKQNQTVLNSNSVATPSDTAAQRVVKSGRGGEARLPFTVRVVDDDESLARALRIRQEAYQRRVPDFARTMDQPEPYDREPG